MKTLHSTTIALVLLSATGFSYGDGMNSMNMKDMPMSGQMAEQMNGKVHHGIGVVQRMDAINGRITIAHGPINSIQWPAMTMTFAVQDKKLLSQVKVGEKVAFDLMASGKDQYVVVQINQAHD